MTATITLDQARGMHSATLRKTDHPIARRQLQLRETTGAIVRGALAAQGLRFRATQGWNISAFATPDGHVGFVNTATGVAVVTDVEISPEAVEALTVPDQADGPVSSGAAAWSSPDAGESHRASAPAGWRQLIMDLRDYEEVADIRCTATVVVWGLHTCYSDREGKPERGWPGYQSLSLRTTGLIPLEDCPADDDISARIAAIGTAWLDTVAMRLATMAGCEDAVREHLTERRVDKAISVARAPLNRSMASGYSAAAAVESKVSVLSKSPTRRALRRAGVYKIANACGDTARDKTLFTRQIDLCSDLLELVLIQRLTPVAETMWAQLAPFWHGQTHGMEPDEAFERWLGYDTLPRLIEPLIESISDLVLKPIAAEVTSIENEMIAAYFANGPVTVSIPVEMPESPS